MRHDWLNRTTSTPHTDQANSTKACQLRPRVHAIDTAHTSTFGRYMYLLQHGFFWRTCAQGSRHSALCCFCCCHRHSGIIISWRGLWWHAVAVREPLADVEAVSLGITAAQAEALPATAAAPAAAGDRSNSGTVSSGVRDTIVNRGSMLHTGHV